MTLEESLKLERYKLVTQRQTYFTDLAKDTFNAYIRIFTGFAAGGIAIISTKERLVIPPTVVTALLHAIAALLSLAAVLAIVQIAFCLRRWYGFRNAERDIIPQLSKAEPWAFLFEGMYCVGIVVSVGFVWWGRSYFGNILILPHC